MQTAGVAVRFAVRLIGDRKRVAQVDDLAQRQLAVVRNDDFHQIARLVAVRIIHLRHAVELAIDDVELHIKVAVSVLFRLDDARFLIGQHVLKLVITLYLNQLARFAVPRIKRVVAGKQQLVAPDQHTGDKVVKAVLSLHGDGHVSGRRQRIRGAQHQARRKNQRKYLFHRIIPFLKPSQSLRDSSPKGRAKNLLIQMMIDRTPLASPSGGGG